MKQCIILSFLLFLFHFTVAAQTNQKRIKVSDDIELIKLSEKAYVHVSVTEIGSFGLVSSNGLFIVQDGEAYLFDTPVTPEQTQTLTEWIQDSLNAKVTAFIPNHWHEDCMGGIDYLHSTGVKSYANQMTIDIAKEKGLTPPNYGFTDSLSLKMKGMDVHCYYLGAGHAMDNIVVWIPSEKILFPGCMSKDINSNWLGNVVDGDVNEWPITVNKIIEKFLEAEIVIPGHGQTGGLELLKHTVELLNKK